MKTIAASTCLCICLVFVPALVPAATIDATSAGVEVIAPDQVIFHNIFVPSRSGYYYGVFRWMPFQNKWDLIDRGLEDPTFNTREYYPLADGSSWTYQRSDGGQLTLTVNGTDEICGQTCIRLSGSDGTITYWINNETGVWMARYVNPDTTYTDYCPPMKIAPAQLYVGTQSLNSFIDAGYFYPPGIQLGTLDGWSHFVVKGLEDVTVPAGTFLDCIRATYVFSYTADDGSYAVRTEETWYAQGVGIVKRVQTQAYGLGGVIFSAQVRSNDLESYSLP